MKPALKTASALYEKYFDSSRGSDLEALGAELSALPPKDRRAVSRSITRLADADIERLGSEKKLLRAQASEIDALMADWLERPIALERPGASCIHHLRQAMLERQAFLLGGKLGFELAEFEEALADANCFVVEHDWAKAFAGASDFADGDIRLPYEICAFDFKISGRRVVALMTTAEEANDILMQVMVRGRDYWMVDDDICRHSNGAWLPIGAGRSPQTNKFQSLAEFIGAQVRAITIALDAQVAESEVVRVSEKLVRSREKSGHVPPKPYHVVSLARRSRAAPLASSDGGEPGSRKRLHFRRGHWRHYENHKTWIRWMLVGDPDLGFVEKEYRL